MLDNLSVPEIVLIDKLSEGSNRQSKAKLTDSSEDEHELQDQVAPIESITTAKPPIKR